MRNNKESNLIYTAWSRLAAFGILPTHTHSHSHPECETFNGYTKAINIADEDIQKWWNGLSEERKQVVMKLPNFDKEILEKCTGE